MYGILDISFGLSQFNISGTFVRRCVFPKQIYLSEQKLAYPMFYNLRLTFLFYVCVAIGKDDCITT